jgi:hypothetical protein
MSSAPQEHKQFEDLDALTGKSPRKLFSLSPNDVLVQISLPLVLILAIATRLMMIAQSMSSQDQGPVILDLWKQQLILRVEHVLSDWEKESNLPAFQSFDRVRWDGQWPDDPAFKQLCNSGLELNNIEDLKLNLYRKALKYTPDASGSTNTQFNFLQVMYDPQEGDPPTNIDQIPQEFRIDKERRAYAIGYIDERCRKWQAQIEDLQWGMIDKVVAKLPESENLSDRNLSMQMKKISTALTEKGYPPMNCISDEYGKDEQEAATA